MKYKLAIIFHGVKKEYQKKIVEYVESKWEKYIEKESGIKLDITILQSKSKKQVKLKVFKTDSDGDKIYGTENGKEITRETLPFETSIGKYHQVLFAYDAEQSDLWAELYDTRGYSKNNGELTSWSFHNELFIDTEYTELEVNDRPQEGVNKARTSTIHEIMHALCKKAQRNGRNGVVDHMDSTIVDGKIVEYYKNSFPFTKDGNYQRTLKSLTENNAWDAVVEMNRYKSVAEMFTQQTVEVKEPEIISDGSYRPKNFILQELVSKAIYEKYGERAWQFLDVRMLKNLQWLRENIGSMTVNNWYWGGNRQYSGFDACEYRKDGTSQHNHGRACDSISKYMTAQQVRDFVKENGHKAPYPNIWVENSVDWFHMDVRASDKVGVYFFNV